MGTYLSTPVKEKGTESGDDVDCAQVPLSWALVDMQGWRKSMEDAHVATTGIPYTSKGDGIDAKVFGVFDGHGGAEVARFCQLYLVSVLEQQSTWNVPSSSHAESASESNDPSMSPEGKALIAAFHALDRMIDDDGRRDEINRLRAAKPAPQERRQVSFIPAHGSSLRLGVAPMDGGALSSQESGDVASTQPAAPLQDPADGDSFASDSSDGQNESSTKTSQADDRPTTAEGIKQDEGASDGDGDGDGDPKEQNDQATSNDQTSVIRNDENDQGNDLTKAQPEIGGASAEIDDHDKSDDEAESDESNEQDDDSTGVVGKEEAASLDQNLMDVSAAADQTHEQTLLPPPTSGSAVTNMLKKILSLNGQSGQVAVKIVNNEGEEVTVNLVPDSGAANNEPKGDAAKTASTMVQPPPQAGPSASMPTLVRNGRMVCNLPDHPVHAGCTAIVALMTGKTLTVANAGDSRAVLCRKGGVTYALSYDHKPQQEIEKNRISKAGGFVNHFGRVNGNLNLSRSIGDLKYKQVPGIDPAQQMITAQPDIMQLELAEDDEFIILGCDGIWDCLTNENAVEYVRSRIDRMTPEQIGIEMLDTIISDDPRVTQGIGGDNMTVMIIDLQPSSRTQRQKL